MSQLSFSEALYAGKRKKTRREQFLGQMESAVPWKVFAALCVNISLNHLFCR